MEGRKIITDQFTPSDFYDSCPIIKRINNIVGAQNFKQIIGLSISIFVPLIILSFVTLKENRFFYGSVTMPLEKYGNVLGMSFLGDTMVWPFTFIVPITFLLLKYAGRTSAELLNRICQKASKEWTTDNQDGFQRTVEKAKEILKLNVGWQAKCLKIAPWIIALLFWSYNTATCALHDFIGKSMYPYKADKVVVLKNSAIVPSAIKKDAKFPTTVKLDHKINLPKWDCDIKKSPMSTLTTRVWTIFYYGLLPFILSRLITLIWGVSSFLLAISKWEAKNKKQAIKIGPFGEDGFGGLSYLADTGMSYFYIIVSFILMLTMSFIKEGPEPSWHNYILLIAFVPIAFLSLITPTVAIRQPIVRAKKDQLQVIVREINALSHQILDNTEKNETSAGERHSFQNDRLSSLKLLYDHVSNIPEWPFSSSTYFQVCITMGVPVGMIVLDKVIGKILM